MVNRLVPRMQVSALYLPLQAGERISLGNAYHCDGGGTYIPSGEHISLGICVRGNTYPGGTHITVTPVLPREKSFVELLRVLKKHFDPQPLVIGERFHFYQRSQKTGESIADFVADLRRLSIKCEFGEFLDQALRDRFVCGVKSESLQKKLLTEADLTIIRQASARDWPKHGVSGKERKGSESRHYAAHGGAGECQPGDID